MGDFSFLDSGAQPIRRNTTTTTSSSRQDAAAAPPTTTGSNAAAADATQQQQPRVRIQLPSFRQVQAAEAPSRPINTFRPGFLGNQAQQPPPAQLQQHQQQHQQQQPAPPSWLQQPPAAAAAAGSNAPTPQLPAAGPAAAAPPTQQQQQPSWMAGLPSMTLNTQLPRFSQAAGGASTGSAVGISRPAVQLPAAGSSQGQAAAGGGGAAQQQQQQVPLNAVLVSRRQQGNPVLKHIKSVRWVFADIVPDYLCGPNTAVLFLSLRYHLLQPEYVLSRLQALQRVYRLAVLLLLVDAEEVVKPLLELHRAALGAQAVLVCAWSNEECARYIETFKAYENRPASSIMEHTDTDYMGRLSSVLTSIRGINRSDAYSLARHFGSLADVLQCSELQGFASIPGLGPVKAKRLLDTVSQPFKRGLTAANTAINTQAPASTAAAGAAGAAGAVGGMPGVSNSQHQQGAAGVTASQGLADQQGSPNPEDVDEGLDEELLLEYEEAAKGVAAAAAGGVGAAAAAATVADEGLGGQEGGEDEGEGVDEGGEEVDFDLEPRLLSQGYLDSQEHYLEPASDDGFDAEDF